MSYSAMELITPNQESTLRKWIATFRRRPNELEKAFLQADKGLSKAQIETWLKNEEISQSHGFFQDNSFGSKQFDFSIAEDDLMNILPPLPQEQAWSPIDNSPNVFSGPSQQADLWASMGCYDTGLPNVAAPSLAETRALLSESFNPHWTYMSGSERSSCISSRTWGTSSTFSDVYSDTDESNYSRLSKASSNRPLALLSSSNTIAEEGEPCHCPCIKREPDSKALPTRPSTSKLSKPQPKLPTKPEKGPAKYLCTVCHCAFVRKGDWERHEDSQHDPQTYWTCMLGNAAIRNTSLQWECAFCDVLKNNQAEMAEHLLKRHKVNRCARKDLGGRTWTRKDKLKQHLQQVHGLAESASLWKEWHHAPARRKLAWGCGYCGACSFTWEGRLSHIAEHYETQSLHPTQWSSSLVIKGLLKQPKEDFNVASSWKRLVTSTPNGDRNLEWSPNDAAILKRKLEYHEGTAQELALEARRLAIELGPGQISWRSSQSSVGSMTGPLSMDLGEKIWPEAASLGGHQSFSSMPQKVDTDMPDAMSYI